MPIDSRYYFHRDDCQCPECQWKRKQHTITPEAPAGKNLTVEEWCKLFKQLRKKNKVKLEKCPQCHKKSKWLNPYTQKGECLNTKCPTNSLTKWLNDKLLHSD